MLTGTSAWAVQSITVLADSSLGVAVSAIARDYARENILVINTSFAPMSLQQAQINEGGAADVIITPRAGWLDALRLQGLVDLQSQSDLFRVPLCLIASQQSPLAGGTLSQGFPTAAMIMDMKYDSLFVLPYPESLFESAASREALQSYRAADDLEPYTIYLKDRQEILSLVRDQHGYAVTLCPAAAQETGVRILGVFPDAIYRPLVYKAAALAGGNTQAARDFIRYLQGSAAQKRWIENGFKPL